MRAAIDVALFRQLVFLITGSLTYEYHRTFPECRPWMETLLFKPWPWDLAIVFSVDFFMVSFWVRIRSPQVINKLPKMRGDIKAQHRRTANRAYYAVPPSQSEYQMTKSGYPFRITPPSQREFVITKGVCRLGHW